MLPKGMWTSLFITSVLLFSVTSFAEMGPENTTPSYPVPTIEKEDGKVVTATWPDGRVAKLQWARRETARVPVDMEATESTCGANTSSKFEYTVSYRLDSLAWYWVEHEDPEKIGQILEKAFPQGNDESMFSWSPASLEVQLTQEAIANNETFAENESFPADTLHLQGEVSWLPDYAWDDNQLVIQSWTAEAMLDNPETGIAENRIVSGAYGVTFTPTAEAEGEYELSQVGHWYSLLPGGGLSLFGDVVGWSFADANGSTCQVSLKPDFIRALGVIEEHRGSELSQPEDYPWGEVDLADLLGDFQVDYLLEFSISSDKGYAVR